MYKPCAKQRDRAENDTDEQTLYVQKVYHYECKWLTVEIVFTVLVIILVSVTIVNSQVELGEFDVSDQEELNRRQE